jgi:short subunit fatty acids transporter
MPVGIRLQKNPSFIPASRNSFPQRLTSFFVQLFERYTPDPYILAVGLSVLTGLLAAIFAPKGSLSTILTGWYNGLFSILAFAFQVVLILVTGYALSTSRPVRLLLRWLASFGSTPRRAIVVTIVTVFIASFLNWGFGLIVAGLLTREIAQRIRIDFGWLVAGAYSGVDDFFQRILQFDSPLASNSRFKPEHRTESYRSGLATRVDASYSSESGNRFAFI